MSLVLTDDGVNHTSARGEVTSIEWKNLVEVSIVALRDDARVCDFSIVLTGADGMTIWCAEEDSGAEVLMNFLLTLEGFDYEAFAQGVQSQETHSYVCWRRM